MSSGFRSFLSKKSTTHDVFVGDEKQTLAFYPVSVARLLGLKDLVAGAMRSIVVLLQAEQVSYRDLQRTNRKTSSDGGMSGFEESRTEAATPDVLEYRSKERDTAIDGLTNSLFHPQNVKATAEIVIDCLREEYPKGVEAVNIDEWLKSTDADVFVQLVQGVMKSNQKLFAPLIQKLNLIRAKLGDKTIEQPESPQPKPEEPSATG